MKIELRNIKHSPSLSEETEAFTADIFIDGKKVGYAKNSGHGGNTDYHAHSVTDRDKLKKAEEFCKTLPSKVYNFGGNDKEYPMDLESLIDDLLGDYLQKKDLQKSIKKMDKRCETMILVVNQKEMDNFVAGKSAQISYREWNFKRPIAFIPIGTLRANIMSIKLKLAPGEVIYNKNLPDGVQ